jgi:hypothetical protein
MPKGLLFWLIFVIWVVLWAVARWRAATDSPYLAHVDRLFIAVLMFILGWATFGFVVED